MATRIVRMTVRVDGVAFNGSIPGDVVVRVTPDGGVWMRPKGSRQPWRHAAWSDVYVSAQVTARDPR